jgi:hypothetical protein
VSVKLCLHMLRVYKVWQLLMEVLRVVPGVEMFKKLLNEGQAGENVGLLLRGVKRDDVERGQVGGAGFQLSCLCVWGGGPL